VGVRPLVRAAYRRLPFKRPLFEVLRYLRPPLRLYQHLYFEGPFTLRVAGRNLRIIHHGSWIENDLFWRGLDAWERTSLGVWIDLCRRSRTIFDVGANTGIYSLIAKAVNPGARVYAFEPLARIHEKLENNCALNGYDIVCERKAVSDVDGSRTLYDVPVEHPTSVSLNPEFAASSSGAMPTPVECVRLSSYLRTRDLAGVDLMKIDVETHEPEVLLGMGDQLASDRPSIVIEILTDAVPDRDESIIAPLSYVRFHLGNSTRPRRVSRLRSQHYLDTNFLPCTAEVASALGLIEA